MHNQAIGYIERSEYSPCLVSGLAVGLMLFGICADVADSGLVERYEWRLTFGQVSAII